MSEPVVTAFFKRFAVKFVEVVGAGVATALSGYLLAHFSGYWSSPASTPPAVQVAPISAPNTTSSCQRASAPSRLMPLRPMPEEKAATRLTGLRKIRAGQCQPARGRADQCQRSQRQELRLLRKPDRRRESSRGSESQCRQRRRNRSKPRFAPPSPTSTQAGRRRPRSCRDQIDVIAGADGRRRLSQSRPRARPLRLPSPRSRPPPKQRRRRSRENSGGARAAHSGRDQIASGRGR